MPLDYQTQKRHLEKKISELKAKDFLPPELVGLIERLAEDQLEAKRACAPALPDASELASPEDNLQGKPLLERSRFPVDHGQAKRLFAEFLTLIKDRDDGLGEAAEILQAALDTREIELKEAFARFLDSDEAYFAKFGEKTPKAPRALAFLTQASLTPSIEAAAEALAAGLDLDKTRQHGHCPLCGSLPLVLTLREKQGYRYATCSFCRTAYRIRRLACPFCDQSDIDKLTYFEAEGLPGYRVEVCASCKTYIKTADFRNLDKISIPVLDDLESLALDFLAQEQGYKRPVLSAWGF
ncbi:MAG: formate dehydrogenase accessory protein FdhE [Desulfovibrionaceae bacterium]|nr:formate dehydrogenase accessory protein FdhE [Desulfovibrionaceae bacterium]